MKQAIFVVAAFALIAAACGGGTTATTGAPTTTQAPATTAPPSTEEMPATGPSEIAFSVQESDGTTITVDSVTMPSPGFVAVHAEADGKPGPIVGHSDLLPAGTSTDVVVALDSPLTGSAKLFPMVHIDMNGNGEYEFFPPDTTIDVPGTFADGSVAVVGAEVTVQATAATTLNITTTGLGTFLVDGDGNTLYIFIPDNQGDSTCYDACADNWPPLTGSVTTGGDVDESLLGTTARADGVQQATYNGWPLYYFAADSQAGDTNGQGVKDVWYVVDPAGNALMSPTLTTSTSDLGTFLVDGDGNTLYIFIPDNQGNSTCYDACADNWPPLIGDFEAGEGVDASLIGTTTRDDASAYQAGSEQATYNGWPLYYFAADSQAGDTNGQGVKDVWYVVDPTGNPIK